MNEEYRNVKKLLMRKSPITTKGQTTLPRAVRSALDLAPQDRMPYVILDGEVRLGKPVKARPVAGLVGILARPAPKLVTLEAMTAAIAVRATDPDDPDA